MALFKSDRLTGASGSIGGTTFSHNRYGLYFRARRKPVNPNTGFQQNQRNAFAVASSGWRSTLTDAERASWGAVAAGSPTTNALGDAVTIPGVNQYVAVTSFMLRLGLVPPTAAPSQPGRVPLGDPVIVADDSANTIVVTGLDPNMDTATLAVFVGSAVGNGVSFFSGPYQLRGSVVVTAETATFAAATGRNGVPLVAGQRVPIRLAGVTDDGRLSTVYEQIVTVVA